MVFLNQEATSRVAVPETLRRRWSLESKFLAVGLFFGLLFISATPPFQVADESRHFVRAYHIAEEILYTVGWISSADQLPKSLVESIEQMDPMRFDPEAKTTLAATKALMGRELQPDERDTYPETALYTFVCYLPQIALIIPFRLAQVNAVVTLYAGRVIALLFWLAVTCWAIRLLPVGRHLLFFIALLPMTVLEAGSLSADCVTLSLSFLLVACYLRLAYKTTLVKRRELVFVGIIGALLTATKLVYLPLIGLHFLISPSRFRSYLAYILSFVLTALACVIVLFLSYSYVLALIVPDKTAVLGNAAKATSYPQLNFLLESPLNWVRVILATGGKYGRTYMDSFVASMGWSGASLPSYLNVVTVIMLWLTALSTNSRRVIQTRHKLLLGGIVALVTLIIFIALCTDTLLNGTPTLLVRGIQGRYFTPIAMLIGLLAANQSAIKNRYGRYVKVAVLPFIFFLLLNAFYVLVKQYYVI